MHHAFGQIPDQPAVDRPETQPSFLGPLPGARHVVENPFHFRGAEIRVDQQARLLTDHVGQALAPEFVAERRGPAVLPDDGVVDRLARDSIPDDGRLALVADADAADLEIGVPERGDGLGHDGRLRRPDFDGLLFYPARLGEILRKFFLTGYHDVAFVVEDDGAGAGRSLVEGEDIGVFFHERSR